MMILGETGGGDWIAMGRLLWTAIQALTWVPRRFLASARADRRRRGVSLTTIGFGIPIVWVITAPVTFVLTGGAVEPNAIGGLYLATWALLGWISLSLGLAYPLLHVGDAIRVSVQARERMAHRGRWVLAILGVMFVDLSFLAGGMESATDSSGLLAGATLILSAFGLQVAAIVWGVAGRPNLVRWIRP